MPFTLTMPKLSPTMESGTIVKWRKKVGDLIEAGDVLMEVATDKATVEHTAIDGGYLRQILVGEGGEAIVNQAVAILTETANESFDGYKPEGTAPQVKVATVTKDEPVKETIEKTVQAAPALATPAFALEEPLQDYQFTSPVDQHETRIVASPLAKKLAKEHGLDLSTVKGTGSSGRITSKDLSHAQKEGLATFGSRKAPEAQPGSFELEPLSPMRKSIAKRLQESKTFIPHFYLETRIDAGNLWALREELKEGGLKLTVNDFIIKAVAMALREHKALNSAFDAQKGAIALFKTVDIAIAVSLSGGLITPIIRHADYKNIGEISLEVKDLAERAKAGKLTPQEYKGGSFTISNLGMYGLARFSAIINPPQSAILAVGGILDEPVIKNDAVVPGKVMNLTLSCDHRSVDGSQGAEFLRTLKKLLEHPTLLIVH